MSVVTLPRRAGTVALGMALAASLVGTAAAQLFSDNWTDRGSAAFGQAAPQAQPQSTNPDGDDLAAALRRQLVFYPSNQPAGTIIIDTAHTFL